jgi:hypothetical protein
MDCACTNTLGALVFFAVSQMVEYGVSDGFLLLAVPVVAVMVEAGVAMSALLSRLFSEVSQQLATSACVVVLQVCDDGLDALFELQFPFFVRFSRDDEFAAVDTVFGISNKRNVLSRNEVDNAFLVEPFQRLVGLVAVYASFLCNVGFVNVAVVGEQSAVVA